MRMIDRIYKFLLDVTHTNYFRPFNEFSRPISQCELIFGGNLNKNDLFYRKIYIFDTEF